MPFQLIQQDITGLYVDAIVNAANQDLREGGGVCGAIFRAAGRDKLARACANVAPIETGEAVMTPGFGLLAPYIIHTAGPVYQDGQQGEEALLRSCYRNSLALAKAMSLNSIAFPLISSGIYGYPKQEALAVAVSEIRNFLEKEEMDVYLTVLDKEALDFSRRERSKLKAYLAKNLEEIDYEQITYYKNTIQMPMSYMAESARQAYPDTLEAKIAELDESFSDTILRLIDSREMSDVEVYKRANLSRKLFSKIRSGNGYMPSKRTAVALAIGLELTLEETKELMAKAGYALSRSQKFDVIVEYFLVNQNYDIYRINEALFEHDQPLLGS